MTSDSLTILHARGRRLAKMIRRDGTIDGYDSARHFDLVERPVAALQAVAAILQQLEPRTDCAVVRGAIADPARTDGVRRLVHADPATGDQPTLRERPRLYLALDLDGVPLPAGLDRRDLAACADEVVKLLPPAFHGAQHIVAATGSHLLKPGARLRLWFWLSRPVGQAELAAWLRDAPVDAALFRPAQLIYTAAPLFPAGAADPMPCRTMLLPGAPVVDVPSPAALAPPPRPASAPPPSHAAGGSRYASAALARGAARVASAAVDSRHATAVAEARSLARLVNAGLLTGGEVTNAIGWAIQQAGKSRAEGEAIVAWAIAQRGDSGNLPAGVVG
jgi:hypothetical protein